MTQRRMRYVCFHLNFESCQRVAGNMDQFSILRAWSKEKGSPLLKGSKKAWVTHWLDEIKTIGPHMKYEVVEKDGGNVYKSSWGEIRE